MKTLECQFDGIKKCCFLIYVCFLGLHDWLWWGSLMFTWTANEVAKGMGGLRRNKLTLGMHAISQLSICENVYHLETSSHACLMRKLKLILFKL